MDWIQALILGLVQGLTEFLPVSSSAHLKIAKKCLGIADGEHLLLFDLVCHAGTWLALVFYLRRDILRVLGSFKQIAVFSLALAPLVPAYFLLKPLRIALSDPSYLGYFLIFTGLLLYSASRKKTPECVPATAAASPPAATQLRSLTELRQRKIEAQRSERGRPCLESKPSEEDRFFETAASPPSPATQLRSLTELRQRKIEAQRSERGRPCLESKPSEEDRFFEAAASPPAATQLRSLVDPPKKWSDVLCIGAMQALALIPGISRSGSTVSAARFCGWNWKEAARFSFLLAVPTIFGGLILETAKALEGESPVSAVCYAMGFLASLSLGMAGVRFIFWVYEKGNVRPFAWYCFGLGLLMAAIL